jgi:predicted Zn-dependent protease with MMP-like domain
MRDQPGFRTRFEELVERALDDLPVEFLNALHNVDILIEDRPRSDDLRQTKVRPRCTLLGVYRGVPLTRRGRGYHMTTPDTIVIFREPIERLARDEADLEERVRRVVRHEVAHYFGISDERLREIGAY